MSISGNPSPLAIFIIRFIHDCSAFLFYITHDVNRNKVTRHNYIFRLLRANGYVLLFVTPALAIMLGLLLRTSITNQNAIYLLIIYLGVTHYYLESHMWKRESPHRQHIAVK
jgi:hypothetical protein